MKNKTNQLGYTLLIISSLLMLLVYIFRVAYNITSFDIIVIRDINQIFFWILKQINKVHFIAWTLFLVSLVYLANLTFQRNVNRIMNAVIVLTIIIYVLFMMFSWAKAEPNTIAFFGRFYSLLYTIFCISFILFLIIFEPKLNFGILLLSALVLQVFVLEIPFLTTWYNNKLFNVLGVTLKTLFQGLSYLLFTIYGFKKIAK